MTHQAVAGEHDLFRVAREQMEAVRFRQRHLKLGEISEGSWVMVLELYIARCSRATLSVTSLCYASGLSLTSAIRRIDELEKENVAIRSRDPKDKRRILVTLTDHAFLEVERYLHVAKSRVAQASRPVSERQALASDAA